MLLGWVSAASVRVFATHLRHLFQMAAVHMKAQIGCVREDLLSRHGTGRQGSVAKPVERLSSSVIVLGLSLTPEALDDQ